MNEMELEHDAARPPMWADANAAIERNRATSRWKWTMTSTMAVGSSPATRASTRDQAPRRRRCSGDGGAALVEFALVMPVLFLLVFGIIEFGWAYYQTSDVRHGARETARLAAVNFNPDDEAGVNQSDDIIVAGCSRMDDQTNATISISLPSGAQLGAKAVVTVTKPLDSITGFMDAFLPASTDDTVAIRLEQTATWSQRTQAC